MLTLGSLSRTEVNKTSRTFEAYLQDVNGNKFNISKGDFNFPYSSNNLTMGAVSSASISCEVLSNALRKNQVLTLFIKIKGVSDEDIQLGIFKVTEVKKIDSEYQAKQRIVAYDKINFLTQKIYSSTGTKTIAKIWEEICLASASSGFTREYESYNGTFSTQTIDSALLSGYNVRDAMSYLASYIGCNVVVNNEGKYTLRRLTKYNYALLYYNRISTPTIDETDTAINYIVAKKSNDVTLTAGDTTGQGFVVTNPIADQTMLENVLSNFQTTLPSYRVGQIDYVLADPAIQCGDIIPLYSKNRPTVSTDPSTGDFIGYIPVMEIKYSFDGGLSCAIYSNKPNENANLTLAEKINFSVKDVVDSKKYAQSAIDFSTSMSQGLGMYTTEIVDSTGAKIFYLHDKTTLESSKRIWKVSSAGIGFATSWQGENTVFVTGVNAAGNIITNMLTVYKINADMIEAGAVKATNIDVDDLSALNATIANWTIHSNLLYVPSEKQSDGTYSYGVGLSNTTVAFYAGYQSDNETYNTNATHPGSPYEKADISFNFDKVNFYVTRAGRLVAKNAEINGKITSTSTDGNGKVVVDNGGFECYARLDKNSGLLKYGIVKAAIDGNISSTVPAMCIQSDSVNSSGIILSASPNSWYLIYNQNYTQLHKNIIGYRHSMYGSLYVNQNIIAESYVYASAYLGFHADSPVRLLHITENGNITLGDTSLNGNTFIVSNPNNYIYLGSETRIGTSSDVKNLIVSGSVSALNFNPVQDIFINDGQGIKRASTSESLLQVATSGNLVLGSTSQTGQTNIYAKAGSYIRIFNDLQVSPNMGIYFYKSGVGWARALFYDSDGFHVGIDGQTLYLRGSSTSVSSLTATNATFEGTSTFNSRFNVFNGFVQISQGYGLYFDVDGQGNWKRGASYSAASSSGIGFHWGLGGYENHFDASYNNFNGSISLSSSSQISFNFGTISEPNRIIYIRYGTIGEGTSAKTGFHLGASQRITHLWGSFLLSSGTAVTSDVHLKKEINDLTEKHELFFSNLKAKTYKYLDGQSDRTHCGFIAQDVKEAIDSAELSTQDVAAYVADKNEYGKESLSLRYSEFVALNTHMIQKCLAKISSLEDEINLLKEAIKNG